MSLTLRDASRRFSRLGLWLFLTAALLSFAAPSAQANFIVPPPPQLSITITDADDPTKSWSWSTPTGTDNTVQEWFNNADVWSSDHSILLAHFNYVQVQNDNDPVASVFFGVVSGAVPTNFTITSGVVSFAPILNPIGSASAAVTVTDFDSNGASLTGNYPGPMSYQAVYNGVTVFTTQIGTNSVGVNGSNSINIGPVNAAIPGAVTSLESVFKFSLSPNDLGSGTGRFSVPEPSSVCLAMLGAAGLAFFARRRRRD